MAASVRSSFLAMRSAAALISVASRRAAAISSALGLDLPDSPSDVFGHGQTGSCGRPLP